MWTERFANQTTNQYENDWFENQLQNYTEDPQVTKPMLYGNFTGYYP